MAVGWRTGVWVGGGGGESRVNLPGERAISAITATTRAMDAASSMPRTTSQTLAPLPSGPAGLSNVFSRIRGTLLSPKGNAALVPDTRAISSTTSRTVCGCWVQVGTSPRPSPTLTVSLYRRRVQIELHNVTSPLLGMHGFVRLDGRQRRHVLLNVIFVGVTHQVPHGVIHADENAGACVEDW